MDTICGTRRRGKKKKANLNISAMARTSDNAPLQQCYQRPSGNRDPAKKALLAFCRIKVHAGGPYQGTSMLP